MQIIGYCIHDNKQYVVFTEYKKGIEQVKITDGFHDKLINKRNLDKDNAYQWVDKQQVDLKKIIRRLRGVRPWHPLIELFRKKV